MPAEALLQRSRHAYSSEAAIRIEADVDSPAAKRTEPFFVVPLRAGSVATARHGIVPERQGPLIDEALHPRLVDSAENTANGFRQESPHWSHRGETAVSPIVRPSPTAPHQLFELIPALQRAPEALASLVPPSAPESAASPGALPRDTLDRLVQAIRMQYRNGVGEAVVRLHPQHLGAVSIALRIDHGVVSATLRAEQPGVRQWLESHQLAFRQGLASHGLQLDRFIVEGDAPDAERQQREDAPPRRAGARGLRAHGTATFEVRV